MDETARVRKSRAAIRRAFSIVSKVLSDLLCASQVDVSECKAQLKLLRERDLALRELDEKLYDLLLSDELTTEEELAEELTSRNQYICKYLSLEDRVERLAVIQEKDSEGSPSHSIAGSASHSSVQELDARRRYELPRLELKRFDGEVKSWLPFWASFKKIHEDPDIPKVDKFRYLLQAVLPGTRAREVVDSFPLSDENYNRVIESLTSRFGRDDLLVEVYVRELLSLILNNALRPGQTSLTQLYESIETQLRALASLEVTTEKCAHLLYPLVKSCLPSELLRVWQRSNSGSNSPVKERLDSLMLFIKAEVEQEELVSLAAEGFQMSATAQPTLSVERKSKSTKKDQGATAASLYSAPVSCVFCDGAHEGAHCFKAQKMTLEKKREVIFQKKYCVRCLKAGHSAKRCRMKMRCVVCGGQHIMCPEIPIHKSSLPSNISPEKALTPVHELTDLFSNVTNPQVFLQTLRVRISHNGRVRDVRAIVDTGSQRSYVLQSTVRELGLKSKGHQVVHHSLFGGIVSERQKHAIYDIQLSSLDHHFKFKCEVLDQPTICEGVRPIPNGPWIQELLELGVQVYDRKDGPIEILLGADVVGGLLTGERFLLKSGLVALKTKLGWTLMGKQPSEDQDVNSIMSVLSLFSREFTLDQLWRLDVLGITDPGEKRSDEEVQKEVKSLFLETVHIGSDGRYYVQLPWKRGHPPLSDNFNLAKSRLEKVVRKLKAQSLYDDYGAVLKTWEEEGVIEEVKFPEASKPYHYLPHRPVVKMSSATTKIRPVFDASAHEKGCPSLNDCLEVGPNLIELIPNLLIRFRLNQIGVTADIAKAFLQVGVHESNQDFLRFLWLEDDGNLKVYRHKRVLFGVCCGPYLLAMTISHHLDRLSTNENGTVGILRNSFYIDNCITSVEDTSQLTTFIREASEIMAAAQFDLRGWEYSGLLLPHPSTPVLGIVWDKGIDRLSLSETCCQPIQGKITRRHILSVSQKIFDPIGFACPAVLCPKLLLQQTWEAKVRWDDEVDKEVADKFTAWQKELPRLGEIRIPRWLGFTNSSECTVSIHTFCDASQNAYAAAVFMRIERGSQVLVRLLQAKARVAPLKKLTIPRLELIAAVIGCRLFVNAAKALNMNFQSYFWSDSSTVLTWIRRENDWTPFVWNRVKEIREMTSVQDWRHVSGVLNPADLPSRGCTPSQLQTLRWWEGPDWLRSSTEEWPSTSPTIDESVVNSELKKRAVQSLLSHESNPWYSNKFSRYKQCVRLIGWLLRFRYNCEHKTQRIASDLTRNELVPITSKLFLQDLRGSGVSSNSRQNVNIGSDQKIKSVVHR